ncbi:protein-L-isoaspartate(D-aspartate) O-methyltransferase [Kordiimonas sediminis]|nr:protein-L-isoaspartate(D-aspartate) O-methyltransferase [Kordiimonas sediminis]
MGTYRKSVATMVQQDIAGRGIRDQRVLEAVASVDRKQFVPKALEDAAYDDRALPIAGGQTISQPYIVALMAEHLRLKGTDTVLDIGTGSGYAAAVLSQLAGRVISVECIAELAQSAKARLEHLGYDTIQVCQGDGALGCKKYAPYDAIHVAAAAPSVPDALYQQLKVGGRMILPIGPPGHVQMLKLIIRQEENCWQEEDILPVRFVPLVAAM